MDEKVLSVDIEFNFRGDTYTFKKHVIKGEVATIEIGEEALSDKLFNVLCGLDKDYIGEIRDSEKLLNQTASRHNNVLALGARTMHYSGSVGRNVFRTLRLRSDKKTAKAQTAQVLEMYNLDPRKRVKGLCPSEFWDFSCARCNYREVRLVVINKCGFLCNLKVDLTKWKECYIIQIV